MKLLPLDTPESISLVAEWLGREGNYKWLDFGEGVGALSPLSLKLMTQRERHVLRLFTPDDRDLPIGLVALSDVRRDWNTAGSVWVVLGRQRYGGYACRAVSKLLTFGFLELGLEAVSAWTVETNVAARRILEQLNFRYIGRQRWRHWMDGRPYDRLVYDLLASEHREPSDGAAAVRLMRPPHWPTLGPLRPAEPAG